ncbi:hypothetical protein GZ78_17075 [Endozoicomonas numazuensis]|uniref:Uncharacterized protein n=2 Tax=Endozoicomonas numazuensis TaxID=1137799 RepID=A0A081NGA7_9GAMM|nr:hypothetical protein GZ78_17075 [Endozoicomonas numazuensis]
MPHSPVATVEGSPIQGLREPSSLTDKPSAYAPVAGHIMPLADNVNSLSQVKPMAKPRAQYLSASVLDLSSLNSGGATLKEHSEVTRDWFDRTLATRKGKRVKKTKAPLREEAAKVLPRLDPLDFPSNFKTEVPLDAAVVAKIVRDGMLPEFAVEVISPVVALLAGELAEQPKSKAVAMDQNVLHRLNVTTLMAKTAEMVSLASVPHKEKVTVTGRQKLDFSYTTAFEGAANDLRVALSQPAHLAGKLGVKSLKEACFDRKLYNQMRGLLMDKTAEIMVELLGELRDDPDADPARRDAINLYRNMLKEFRRCNALAIKSPMGCNMMIAVYHGLLKWSSYVDDPFIPTGEVIGDATLLFNGIGNLLEVDPKANKLEMAELLECILMASISGADVRGSVARFSKACPLLLEKAEAPVFGKIRMRRDFTRLLEEIRQMTHGFDDPLDPEA